MLTSVHKVTIIPTMLNTNLAQKEESTLNGGSQVAPKNRKRLTIYVDEQKYYRFLREAESMYRSRSDHFNAVLDKYYACENEGNATSPEKETDG